MNLYQTESYLVGIPESPDGSGIGDAIYLELEALGYRPFYFPLGSQVPEDAQVVFLFGPFGKFLHIPARFSSLPREKRPKFVFWNTEGLPDPRLPRLVMDPFGLFRSWVGRLDSSPQPWVRRFSGRPPLSKLDSSLLRFRYLGDYLYASKKGWLDVFADISAVYAGYWYQRGIPSLIAPFGSHAGWYAELNLTRDIDVLWMGKRATRRRSEAIDRLRQELRAHGVEMCVVDNEERPFVFEKERTELLNRTKITLNLLRTWYDENSLRICLAAPNRSMIVSEPLLLHVPQYKPGVHYAAAPIKDLAKTILYYLEHEEERLRITENAYQVTTREVTFRKSMQTIMSAVGEKSAR